MTNLIVYTLSFISELIGMYIYLIFFSVILSWLVNFNVINPYNSFVRAIGQFFSAVTEPVLRPIRNALPDLGPIDISPVVLIFACMFLQGLIMRVIVPAVAGGMAG